MAYQPDRIVGFWGEGSWAAGELAFIRVTHEATDHREVVFETICDDQRATDQAPPEDHFVEHGFGVSIGAAVAEATRPQARAHLDGRKEPRGPALAADERIELIGLKLNDLEVPQHALVEALCGC